MKKLKLGDAQPLIHKSFRSAAGLFAVGLFMIAGRCAAQPASPAPEALVAKPAADGSRTQSAAVQTAPTGDAAKKAALAAPTSAVAPKIVVTDGQDTDRAIWRATHGVLLAVTRAGDKVVAVGDRGIVLVSSDAGRTWKPATSGTSALLTGLLFTNANEGWAVGQDATILHSGDGGQTWTSQHAAPGGDQALFSITALAPTTGKASPQGSAPGPSNLAASRHLVATGAYALALESTDGSTWSEVKLPNLDEDYHLNCVTQRGEDLLVTGEAGHAFIRHAGTWTPIPVPYQGSQFGCVTTPDGTVLSFGLRGSLFTLAPQAASWKRIDTGEQRSIFGGAMLADGHVALVGGNGLALVLDVATGAIKTLPPPTGATLSGVTEVPGGKWIAVGDDGVHLVDPAAPDPVASDAARSAVQ